MAPKDDNVVPIDGRGRSGRKSNGRRKQDTSERYGMTEDGEVMTRGEMESRGNGDGDDWSDWEPDFSLDDIGNSQRLRHLYDGELHWLTKSKRWAYWDRAKDRWRLDPEGNYVMLCAEEVGEHIATEARSCAVVGNNRGARTLEAWRRKCRTKAKLEAMVSMLKHRAGIAVEDEAYDANPSALAVANGIVELLEGGDGYKFRPARRDDLCLYNTDVPYVPAASSAMWDEFLERFLPDEAVRDWLQKVLGYALFGGNPQRIILFLQGPTSSGKTTILEILFAALGTYAGPFALSMFRDSQEAGARPDIVTTLPMRLLGASEASTSWSLHADQVKRITGGDTMTVRPMFSNAFITRKPAFTPIVATNEAPTIRNADRALRRRVKVVRFGQTVAEGEEMFNYLGAFLADGGAAAALRWLLAGWKAYQAEGLSDEPPAVVEATLEFLDQLSESDEFIADCFVSEASEFTPAGDVYQIYLNWCAASGVQDRDRMSTKALGMHLSGRGYRRERESVNGKQVRVWYGLRPRSGIRTS
jgi:P4 family phage/plasmid primase-like protien